MPLDPTQKILCVDDVQDNLKLLQVDLEDEGYVVATAESGEAALAMLEAEEFHAIILDWMMPGLTGIDVLKAVRAQHDPTELPVIMATALSEVENVVLALDAGANDYITKPIEFEILLARLKAHLRVKELTAERDRLAEQRDDFLAIVSHDLKNPIGAIMGFSKLLPRFIDEGALSERGRDMLSRIETNADTMLRMVEDYLDLANLEAGTIQLTKGELSTSILLAKLVDIHRSQADAKQIQLVLDASVEATIRTDGDRLRQILDNFVTNALKFSPVGSTVTIDSVEASGFVVITVSDEGPGLTAEDQKNLFQKFSRLTASPTAGEKSSGVGLYSARLLADALGATLGARNRDTGGASFWLRLPCG